MAKMDDMKVVWRGLGAIFLVNGGTFLGQRGQKLVSIRVYDSIMTHKATLTRFSIELIGKTDGFLVYLVKKAEKRSR